jgi:two-component system LytT family response regulator
MLGGAAHLLHVPMSTIEAALDPGRFLRVHRSYIVNLHHIKRLWTLTYGQYVLELASGERLETDRTY